MELIHEECSQTDVTVTCPAVFLLLLFPKFMSAFSYQLSILLFGPGGWEERDGRKGFKHRRVLCYEQNDFQSAEINL